MLLWLALCLASPALAQDVVAQWNFREGIPSGILATNLQGTTGTVASDVDGIEMTVDATSGKLKGRQTDAQFNQGTILRVPVRSVKDTVEVVSYPGYHNYTIGGEAADADDVKHRATTAEAAQGYVEIVGTATSYLYSVILTQVATVQEKLLYSTTFTDWTDAKAAAAESTVEQTTKYSHESLTFTLFDTQVSSTNGNTAKFPNWTGGYLMASKSADPYIVTSALASITRVHFFHGATGKNRGWRLECKGDSDDDWVLLSDSVADPSTGDDVDVTVNRTNCQLRFTNLNTSQNAYLFQLDIYGNVDETSAPALGSFALNGTTYQAADIFAENAAGEQEATIEISKQQPMMSADNPLTDLTVDNGEIVSTTYTATDSASTALITVVAGTDTAVYRLIVMYKPDYTLTYYDADGTTVLGTQAVEEDATIGTFAVADSQVSVPDGSLMRGWLLSVATGEKASTETVVTADAALTALVTPIETANDTARYEFNLANPYFYPEDHEAFTPVGTGKFHDGTHGWVFAAGDKVQILMGGKGYVKLSLCRYSSDGTIELQDAQGNQLASVSAKAATDGATAVLQNETAADTLYVVFSATCYLHSLDIVNLAELPYTQAGNWYMVKAGDANGLLTTLELVEAANATSDAARSYIFLPNGVYDLGSRCLTTISGYNISIVGESMDSTIIRNTPQQEGIAVTATLLNTSSDLYLGDLTLQNAYPYNGSTGRAVCLQDKGTRTICNKVRMLSYQDTYYSNNNSGQYYFERSDIHGIVDYICGSGDAFFNKCTLTCEGGKSVYITAPYTDGTQWGYVFDSCRVVDMQADRGANNKIYFGRAWGGTANCAFLNTTLDAQAEQHIAEQHWVVSGMNVVARNFYEWHVMNEAGMVIDEDQNVVTFKKDNETNTYNTILSADSAATFTVENVLGSWAPQEQTVPLQAAAKVSLDGTTLTWEAVDGASGYAIVRDGAVVAIVSATTTNYDLGETEAAADSTAAPVYSVKAANAIGVLGEEAAVATGITTVDANAATQVDAIYSVDGKCLPTLRRGVNIVRMTTADGRTVTKKLIVR
jgi:pectin methylesterase-like acyl-CoA thioesterase